MKQPHVWVIEEAATGKPTVVGGTNKRTALRALHLWTKHFKAKFRMRKYVRE